MTVFTKLYLDPGVPIEAENSVAFAVRDGYPVTPGHTLIIPKREILSFAQLHPMEETKLFTLLRRMQRTLQRLDDTITGFNIGINDGPSAGRTVDHLHVHLIPRRYGDVADPTGGVRGVIPEKQKYSGPPANREDIL